MNRRNSNIVVGIIVALGVVGLIYTLFTQPSRIFVQLGMITLFVGVIFLIYKWYMRRRAGVEHSAYLKAAKRSKRRFNEKKHSKSPLAKPKVMNSKRISPVQKKSISTPSQKKKSSTHLTVIEGKKGKKKNRAFF